MIIPTRLLATTALLLAGITLVRPRTGWGRLILFIPKLFAGSRIVHLGMLGLGAALVGWFAVHDPVSVVLGVGASVIAVRHVVRLTRRAREASGALRAEAGASAPPSPQTLRSESPPLDASGGAPHVDLTLQPRSTSAAHLPRPWVGVWRIPRDVRWRRDVEVACRTEDGVPLLADLWRPPTSAMPSGLGIVYLHGSGWHYADKDFGTRPFFSHLAHQGHTILDVAYTLAPHVDLFGMVADVKRAIIWMKTQASALGVRPDRIVMMGGSAGGQLALLAAYTPNHPRLDPPDLRGAGVSCDTAVCGVVSYYGPPDLFAQYERFVELPGLTGRSAGERAMMRALERRFGFAAVPVGSLLPVWIGGTPRELPELYRLGSPSAHVGTHCPPTVLLQGTHDFSGMTPAVRMLHTALRRAGCHSVLFELPDVDHGFDLYKPNASPAAQAATYVTERFLAKLV